MDEEGKTGEGDKAGEGGKAANKAGEPADEGEASDEITTLKTTIGADKRRELPPESHHDAAADAADAAEEKDVPASQLTIDIPKTPIDSEETMEDRGAELAEKVADRMSGADGKGNGDGTTQGNPAPDIDAGVPGGENVASGAAALTQSTTSSCSSTSIVIVSPPPPLLPEESSTETGFRGGGGGGESVESSPPPSIEPASMSETERKNDDGVGIGVGGGVRRQQTSSNASSDSGELMA